MSVKLGRRVLYGVVCVCAAMVLCACGSDDDGGIWALARIDVDVDADGVVDVTELERTFTGGRLATEYQERWEYASTYPNYNLMIIADKSYTYNGDGTLDQRTMEYSYTISDTEYKEGSFVMKVNYFDGGRVANMVTDQTSTLEMETTSEGSETVTYQSTRTQTPVYSEGKLYRLDSVTVSGDYSGAAYYETQEYDYDSRGRCTRETTTTDYDSDGIADEVAVTKTWNSATGLLDEWVEEYDSGADGTIDKTITERSVYDAGGGLFKKTVAYDTDNNGVDDTISTQVQFEEGPLTFDFLRHPDTMNCLFGEAAPNWYETQLSVSKGSLSYDGRNEVLFLNNGTYYLQMEITEFDSNGLPREAWIDYNNDGVSDCIVHYTYVKI